MLLSATKSYPEGAFGVHVPRLSVASGLVHLL